MTTTLSPIQSSGARLSPCGNYRYSLWRGWNPRRPYALFVGLNPSTADARTDDPTIRRMCGFARRWGLGGIRVVNLYAWRATDPDELKRVTHPVSEPCPLLSTCDNDVAIRLAATDADRIIAAWGAWGQPMARVDQVRKLLAGRTVEALALTKDGYPRHPLYVKSGVEPVVLWRAGR